MVTKTVVIDGADDSDKDGGDDDGNGDSGYDRQEAVLMRPSCVPDTVLWLYSQPLWNSPVLQASLGEQLLFVFQSLFLSLLSTQFPPVVLVICGCGTVTPKPSGF